MNRWNRIKALLDSMLGFPSLVSSKVKKLHQGFDNRTQKHVRWIEDQVQVNNVKPTAPCPSQIKASSDRAISE